MNCNLRKLSIIILLLAVFAEPVWARSEPRPNIIFIQTDDQGPWALGASGNADVKTPNLDRLAREGAYLRNHFTVTPVCSPSRASLLTSRYGTEVGITDWIDPEKEPQIGLSPKFVTWSKLLAENGYKNALIGKWHLGTEDRFLPVNFGFEYFMGFREGSSAPQNPMFESGGKITQRKGFNADLLTDDTISFIEQHQNSPFMVMLNYREPHAPWKPMPEEDTAPYKNLEPVIPNPDYPNLDIVRVKNLTKDYLSNVTNLDRNVGRILEYLKKLNLEENTIIIFTSDNGYNIGHHGLLHKGNANFIRTDIDSKNPAYFRPNMFDTSLKIPTIIRWKKVIMPETVIDRTTSNLDWFPTLLAMTKIKKPKDLIVRGTNFLPLLSGKKPSWNDDLYAEFSMHHYKNADLRTYRTTRWKLTRDFKNGTDELYDLQVDPNEDRNLISDAASQKIKRELNAKLLGKMRKINDPIIAKYGL